ncbi:MAG: zinc-ribbon domain-containing protein [Cellulosilyticum sp.]|nr:zinc-ribbon domain-containing protein [Cellulosilyticum sp.]
MLFIMDIIPMMKILKIFKAYCDTCACEGTIELLKSYQCFRLFFIPLFKWHAQYTLKHSCGSEVTISEEVALGILHGTIDITNMHIEHHTKVSNQCTTCGHVLDSGFVYCPYCGGQKKRD